jgi:hypothetical protein
MNHRTRPLILLIFAVLLMPGSLGALNITFVTGSGAGNGSERCLTGAAQDGGTCDTAGNYGGLTSMVQLFADSQGATLTRVDDTTDQLWTIDGPNAGVFAIGRSAGRAFALGTIPGSSPGAFTSVLPAFASNAFYLPSIPAGQNANGDLSVLAGKYDVNNRPASFTPVTQAGNFQFAIQQQGGTDLWSSNTANNSDGLDHMVTWQLTDPYLTANNLVWYIAGFENAVSPGSDRDFNDYVFLYQDVAPDGSAPEPATFVFIGSALIGLGVIRRLRKS